MFIIVVGRFFPLMLQIAFEKGPDEYYPRRIGTEGAPDEYYYTRIGTE